MMRRVICRGGTESFFPNSTPGPSLLYIHRFSLGTSASGEVQVYFENAPCEVQCPPHLSAVGETRGYHLNEKHCFIAHQDSPS
jgi:hypothetical protein